jgi:hypothetical protein
MCAGIRLDLISILVHDLENNYNGKEREPLPPWRQYVSETTTNLGTIPEVVVERREWNTLYVIPKLLFCLSRDDDQQPKAIHKRD